MKISTLLLAGYRAINHAKHALLIDCISRALCLFTFTIKFSIRDNVYPLLRSWNSSREIKIGSTTCNSYHSRRSDVRKTDVHSFWRYFYLHVCHPLQNHRKYSLDMFINMFIHVLVQFYSHFSRNWRGSMCLEFIIALVSTRFSKAISISASDSCVAFDTTCTKRSRTESFTLSSRAIRVIIDYLTSIDNHV